MRVLFRIDTRAARVIGRDRPWRYRMTMDPYVQLRERQIRRYWDAHIGVELGYPVFEDYLADMPEVPRELRGRHAEFPLLVLVEPRCDPAWLCTLLGFDDQGTCGVPIRPLDAGHADGAAPSWMRMDMGLTRRGMTAARFRQDLLRDHRRGLTLLQGICLAAQYQVHFTIRNHCMLAVGSVAADELVPMIGYDATGSTFHMNNRDDTESQGWLAPAARLAHETMDPTRVVC
jgi:hypothetical protein